MYRVALCLALVASTLATPRTAGAVATDSYDTVDAVEFNRRDPNFAGNPSIQVRGIPAGGTTPTTRTYFFTSFSSNPTDGVESATHCHRLAVLAMSKPGKYQFAIGPGGSSTATGCRLTLVTP
jgi:hypothetical protein